MMHIAFTLVFTLVALTELALILATFITSLQNTDSLAYLNLIDLIFPIAGLYAAWRFEPNARHCPPPTSMMAMYLTWCVIWTIVGLILLLVRVGVIQYDSSNTVAVTFLGSPGSSTADPMAIALNAAELGLQFLGIVMGAIGVYLMGKASKGDSGSSNTRDFA